MNLASLVEHVAQQYPDSPAFVSTEREMSYTELLAESNAVALGLKNLGIGPQDRVAIMLPNMTAFPVIAYGVWRLGAELVTVNPLQKAQELEYLLSNSEAKVLFVLEQLLPLLEEVLETLTVTIIALRASEDCEHLKYDDFIEEFEDEDLLPLHPTQPDDVVAILYTSGTTGRPKGALLTSGNLDSNSAAGLQSILATGERTADDRLYCVLPMFHAYALNVGVVTALRGGVSVFVDPRFVPTLSLKNLKRYNCTVFLGVPSIYASLLALAENADPAQLPKLKVAICGSAPLTLETLKGFQEVFQTRILEGYGPTECSPVVTMNPMDKRIPGSVGIPLEGVEVKILDPDRLEFVADGEVGEFVVRGPNVFKGYLKNPEATEQTFFEGWYRTGDLGYIAADGYYYIVDRLKDMIIVGGLNVYSREVEDVLHSHPQVQDCAIVGEADLLRGEAVHAFVERKPNTQVSEEELKDFCRARLADYKCPLRVTFTDMLPRSFTGKVLKRVLKEDLKKSQP